MHAEHSDHLLLFEQTCISMVPFRINAFSVPESLGINLSISIPYELFFFSCPFSIWNLRLFPKDVFSLIYNTTNEKQTPLWGKNKNKTRFCYKSFILQLKKRPFCNNNHKKVLKINPIATWSENRKTASRVSVRLNIKHMLWWVNRICEGMNNISISWNSKGEKWILVFPSLLLLPREGQQSWSRQKNRYYPTECVTAATDFQMF